MLKIKLLILLLFAAVIAGYFHFHKNPVPAAESAVTKAAQQAVQTPPVNHCAGNTLGQEVIVSISAQHMWACEAAKTVYDNPVVTGMEQYPNNLTPTGTYKIYGKQTDQRLTGSDQHGSWDDPVSYWLPFLSNNYGVYGFHDATWRNNSDFGKIDVNAPYTTVAKSGSRGCVELPLSAAKWLYDWAPINTVVTIQS